MIECKFSLELTKNGVQKSIHAKSGEQDSRKAVITLTENGDVFDAAGYNVAVGFEDGTFISSADTRHLVEVKNGCVEFTLPGELTASSGERLCEIQVSNDNRVLYAPTFRVLVEKSIGQDGMKVPVGNPKRYQEVIPDLQSKETISDDDEIAVCSYDDETGDYLTTKRKVSALPLNNTSPELAAVTLVAMFAAQDTTFASVEPPDVASEPDSDFAKMLENISYQTDLLGYYAPPSTGNLEYTEPLTGARKTLTVEKGKAYCFFVSGEDWSFNFQTIDTVEQVKSLFLLVFEEYTNPTKLGELENDPGFVNPKEVSVLFSSFVEARNLVDEYGVTLAFEKLVADHRLVNEVEVNKIVDEALSEFEIPEFESNLRMESVIIDDATETIYVDFDFQTLNIETTKLPVNARVKKIEIPNVCGDTNEYLMLEDMVAKDHNGLPIPYFVMYPKNMKGIRVSSGTVAAIVSFGTYTNSFYETTQSFAFNGLTIKIYYEIEE